MTDRLPHFALVLLDYHNPINKCGVWDSKANGNAFSSFVMGADITASIAYRILVLGKSGDDSWDGGTRNHWGEAK
ncbi:hypothetical protein KCU59_g59, partial [Aureobasidium melanogenum]